MVRLIKFGHNVVITGSDDAGKQVSLNAWNDGHNEFGMFGHGVVTTLTVASDTIIPVNSMHKLDGQGASADDLATITNTETAEFDELWLFSGAQTITLVNSGNIVTLTALDVILSTTVPTKLIRVGTSWYEVGAGGSGIFPDTSFAIQDDGDITKQMLVSLGGASAGFDTTLTFVQTADRAITFFDATDTVVGKATTDAFTNKSYDLGGTGNVLTGSTTEFNTALQSDSFFFISQNIGDMATSDKSEFDGALSDGTFAFLNQANTFTLANTFLDIIHTGRHQYDKGADVASLDAMTLGGDGNVFDVTGTTTVNHINNTNWQIGSVVTLHFVGAVPLNHATGGETGDEASLFLNGDTNYTTSAGDILTFVLLESIQWQETSRNSGAGVGEVFTWTADHDTGGFALTFTDDATSPAGTVAFINWDTDVMQFNVPTSDRFSLRINDVELVDLDVAGGFRLNAVREQLAKGTDEVSATELTLATDGNIFDITASNTINTISPTGWQAGSVITLQFDGAPQVTHNSGGTNDILLGNQSNFVTSAGDVLTLFFNGTDWVEVSRSVVGGGGETFTWTADHDADGFDLILDTDGNTKIINDRDAGVADNEFGFEFLDINRVLWSTTQVDFDMNASGTGLSLINVTDVLLSGRLKVDKGADIVSPAGGIMTLGGDGNVFDVTGTNTTNEILATNWQVGSIVTLQFDDALQLTHNSGGTNDLVLTGGTNYTTSANDVIQFFFNGTDWVEISRNLTGTSGSEVFTWTADHDASGNDLIMGTGLINGTEQTTPSTPASNTGSFYVKDVSAVSHAFFIADDGTEFDLTLGAGSEVFTWTGTHFADGNILSFSSSGVTMQEVSDIIDVTIGSTTFGGISVTKGSTGHMFVGNANSTGGEFSPIMRGTAQGANRNTFFQGRIAPADDSGVIPVFIIDSRQSDNTDVVTRPLMSIANNGTTMWEMDVNGNVDMQGNNLLGVGEITIPDDTIGAGIKIINTDGSLEFLNGIGTAGQFFPIIRGITNGSANSTFFQSRIPVADDSGSAPACVFDVRQADDTPIATRPLYAWRNDNVDQMTMDVNGNLNLEGNNLTTTGELQESGVPISSIGLHDMYLDAGGFVAVDSGALTTRINGSGANQKAFAYIPFTNGSVTYAVAKLVLPRTYDLGTITAIVHWTSETEGAGTVEWDISAVAISDAVDIAGTAYGTAITATDTQTTIDEEQISPRTTAITIGNTPIDADMIYIKIQRDGTTDTFDQEAQLLGVWLDLTTDVAVSA